MNKFPQHIIFNISCYMEHQNNHIWAILSKYYNRMNLYVYSFLRLMTYQNFLKNGFKYQKIFDEHYRSDIIYMLDPDKPIIFPKSLKHLDKSNIDNFIKRSGYGITKIRIDSTIIDDIESLPSKVHPICEIYINNDNQSKITKFIKQNIQIKYIRFFGNVDIIRKNFSPDCPGLTYLDLTPLSNITSIGSCFSWGCSGLKQLDLTPLSNITKINDYFLSRCSGLNQLDLTPLSNITSIGSYFLSECSGLKQLDLTHLSNITQIDHGFLYRCSGLKHLDLTPLSNITSIGAASLLGCSGLKQLDLTPLSNITNVTNICNLIKE